MKLYVRDYWLNGGLRTWWRARFRRDQDAAVAHSFRVPLRVLR